MRIRRELRGLAVRWRSFARIRPPKGVAMPNYVHCCPGCGADEGSISWSAAYFDVYECKDCDREFCYKCRGTNGGRHCPKCEGTNFRSVARVSKR